MGVEHVHEGPPADLVPPVRETRVGRDPPEPPIDAPLRRPQERPFGAPLLEGHAARVARLYFALGVELVEGTGKKRFSETTRQSSASSST